MRNVRIHFFGKVAGVPETTGGSGIAGPEKNAAAGRKMNRLCTKYVE